MSSRSQKGRGLGPIPNSKSGWNAFVYRPNIMFHLFQKGFNCDQLLIIMELCASTLTGREYLFSRILILINTCIVAGPSYSDQFETQKNEADWVCTKPLQVYLWPYNGGNGHEPYKTSFNKSKKKSQKTWGHAWDFKLEHNIEYSPPWWLFIPSLWNIFRIEMDIPPYIVDYPNFAIHVSLAAHYPSPLKSYESLSLILPTLNKILLRIPWLGDQDWGRALGLAIVNVSWDETEQQGDRKSNILHPLFRMDPNPRGIGGPRGPPRRDRGSSQHVLDPNTPGYSRSGGPFWQLTKPDSPRGTRGELSYRLTGWTQSISPE